MDAARTVIEAALQRARDEKPADQSHQRTRWTPDVVKERARVRVTRLEQALQAMGDLQCAEADMLQKALKRARQSAQDGAWPTLAKPTLAKPTLANFLTDFGQTDFGQF